MKITIRTVLLTLIVSGVCREQEQEPKVENHGRTLISVILP